MTNYRKLIAALAAGCGVAASVLADGVLSPADGLAIAAAFLGALGVYAATNTPNTPNEGA
jgi:drug/metabolite transporter (DMT)-like permease